MSIRREKNKKPGVSYALGHLGQPGQVGAKDEIELPVVDVTNPAFALAPTDAELAAEVARFLKQPQPLAGVPAFLRRPVLRFLLRGSVLARGIRSAGGGLSAA